MLRISRINPRTLSRPLIRYYATKPDPYSSLAESYADPPQEQVKEKTKTTSLTDSKPSTSLPQAPSNPSPFYRPEPPFVAAARAKTVKRRNIFESYLVLDPKVRLYFSLSVMLFAAIGLWAGDRLVPLTDEEKEANELAK